MKSICSRGLSFCEKADLEKICDEYSAIEERAEVERTEKFQTLLDGLTNRFDFVLGKVDSLIDQIGGLSDRFCLARFESLSENLESVAKKVDDINGNVLEVGASLSEKNWSMSSLKRVLSDILSAKNDVCVFDGIEETLDSILDSMTDRLEENKCMSDGVERGLDLAGINGFLTGFLDNLTSSEFGLEHLFLLLILVVLVLLIILMVCLSVLCKRRQVVPDTAVKKFTSGITVG